MGSTQWTPGGYQNRQRCELGRAIVGDNTEELEGRTRSEYNDFILNTCIKFSRIKKKLGKKSFEKIVNWVVLHALNLSTREVEAGKSLNWR